MYDDNTIKSYELKGFFTYYARITEPYVSNTFIVYAQYYHGTVQPSINSSISFTTSGLSGGFSISPSYQYTQESHPMEVRAKNIYKN